MDLQVTFSKAHETPITQRYTVENCPQRPSRLLSHNPPKECQQNYSEANKDINGCSWQLAPALCIHYVSFFSPNTQKTAIKPLLCVYDGLCCAATPAFRGPWLPQLRQSEVSNEYTCVVCSREDTGRNRASQEDEYWVNVPSWERAPLPAPQPQRLVLLVSVWLVNINIYTAVTIRIYRTFSALHVRDT